MHVDHTSGERGHVDCDGSERVHGNCDGGESDAIIIMRVVR